MSGQSGLFTFLPDLKARFMTGKILPAPLSISVAAREIFVSPDYFGMITLAAPGKDEIDNM